MTHRVVCISATDGSGGQEVAELVAHKLGFRVVDEAIVARAAQQAGVDSAVIADVEARKSALRRLLDDLGSGSGVSALAVGGGFVPPLDDDMLTSDELRALIRDAVEEAAAEGNAVIVAHAASFALAGRDDVLRVLVTGSPERCCQRLGQERGLSEQDAAAALKRADAARADYLRRFYRVSDERPTHYDLVVSTDRLSPAQAADLVTAAAR